MAITQNNVENVKFLRNQRPFETREAARTALENNKGVAADGTSLLARYSTVESGATVIKTIVGYVAVVGETHHLTIIDVEGASEDVEKLRREINAKLGTTFISSDNTVEANLTALSGNARSTSAEASVEGAKRYADELKNQMDYSGVTTGTGVYITNVTQADGIVSATTATLPSVTDAKEAKKVVVSVSEDKGVISIERGTISSTAKTMVLTDNTDGGVNFEVNIDNETIIQDAETKKLKVADTALVQYVGDEDTIHISVVDAQNNKTVSSLLTIEKVTTGLDADVREAYRLVGHSGNTIGDLVKIYKDSSLLSVALLHADTTANPQVLPEYNKETDTWTDIATPTEANQALCFAYENVSGTTVIAAVPVGAFINEQEFASGITWDSAAGKVKGVVDSTSETFLTVGANGFKLSGVQDAIDAAVNGLDATVSNSGNSGHVGVEIVEENGKLVSVAVSENDIASANDIEELSAKTITNIKSTNSSIDIATANTSDGTVEVNVITNADKIQMSGFSAGNTTALSGIAESDSIATAFEKTNAVITENERVTAEALTELDGRLDVVEAEYISGVSVNGKAVTLTDKVAPISITAATSAATGTTAIVVDTAANGNITIGIANIDCGYYDGTQG